MSKKKIGIIFSIVAAIMIVAVIVLAICLSKADTIYYGKIVTMDESNPNAEAVAIKGDKISFVGSAEEAKNHIGPFTRIKHYGENYIYPGFIDGHSHLGIFSTLETNGAQLDSASSLKDNALLMKKYIEENPGQEVYKGYGWWRFAGDAHEPSHELLDKYTSTDVPVVIVDAGGHSAILNQKAIEYFDLKNKISIYGTDGVQIDSQGNPTGYLTETPRFDVCETIKVSKDNLKQFFLFEQEKRIQEGYTTIMDAGIIETDTLPMITALKELAEEGKLKLKLRSYVQISETDNNKLEKVDQIAKWAKEINYDKFKIIGVKIFLDGVPEALTSWTSQPYIDKSKGSNYQGYKRWDDKSKQELIDIIKKSNDKGLMVHFHSMGEGATSYALDCFEAARAGKTDFDYRNGLAHLSNVDEKDYQRFIDNKVSAFVAPQWSSLKTGTKENEEKIYGVESAKQMYKVKTFLDKGITTSFHTDGMCKGGVPEMIYSGATRMHPIAEIFEDGYRGLSERIGGMDCLKCMTTSTAYTMKEENNLGKIKVGMSADFTIANQDFTDDKEVQDPSVLYANMIASVSSGKCIYPYYEF